MDWTDLYSNIHTERSRYVHKNIDFVCILVVIINLFIHIQKKYVYTSNNVTEQLNQHNVILPFSI